MPASLLGGQPGMMNAGAKVAKKIHAARIIGPQFNSRGRHGPSQSGSLSSIAVHVILLELGIVHQVVV